MMMLNRIKSSCIILILITVGCTDDNDLKLPVRTNLEILFLGFYTEQYNELEHEEIILEGSIDRIGIQRLEFEGMREVGDDIYFETDPEIDLLTSQYREQRASIFDFYLPQGIYNYIRLDMNLQTVNTGVWITEVDASSNDIGFIITGYYTHYRFQSEDFVSSIHYVLLIDRTEKYIFRSAQDVVIKQPDSQILIIFDLNKAFQSLDLKMFEEAELTGDGEYKNMIISSTKNRDLYENIIYRLGMSTKMTVY